MIAPQPFFEPRGTPFSEFHRIRALTALGHQVDLVTYPFGDDVEMPGLRIFRCARPPFVRRVKIGPSLAKIPLDLQLMLTALGRVVAERYDAVHSHEEGGLIGVVLAAAMRVPHLYDMHSSLPQQLTNFAFSGSPIVRRVFLGIERLMIRRSRVVIVICPSLEDTVRAIDPAAQVILIENAPGSAEGVATPAQAAAVREAFGLGASTPVVLYTGTFEAYQGLDLLFAERDRFSPAEVAQEVQEMSRDVARRLRSLPSNDAALAMVIKGRKVVLGIAGLEVPDLRFARPPAAPPIMIANAADQEERRSAGHAQHLDAQRR